MCGGGGVHADAFNRGELWGTTDDWCCHGQRLNWCCVGRFRAIFPQKLELGGNGLWDALGFGRCVRVVLGKVHAVGMHAVGIMEAWRSLHMVSVQRVGGRSRGTFFSILLLLIRGTSLRSRSGGEQPVTRP